MRSLIAGDVERYHAQMTVLSALAIALSLAEGAAAPTRAPEVDEAIRRGDEHYARRAEGSRQGPADPREIEAAVGSYRQAVVAAPTDADALFRLLRALHFEGAFCGLDGERQKALFDEGRRLGQAAVDRLERSVEGKKPEDRLAALRLVPGAAEVYFWTAACWGQWALVRGKFAAARQGVAGKVRDLAQTVVDLDPQLEEGGGYRVLGRLHDQAPHIPFVTGWVSKDKAVEYLRRAYAIAPYNLVTRFFLAEAILEHDSARRDEARRLLKSSVDDPPRPEYLIEDRYYAEQARARLAGLK